MSRVGSAELTKQNGQFASPSDVDFGPFRQEFIVNNAFTDDGVAISDPRALEASGTWIVPVLLHGRPRAAVEIEASGPGEFYVQSSAPRSAGETLMQLPASATVITDGSSHLLAAVDGDQVIPIEENGALPLDRPITVEVFRKRLHDTHERTAMIPNSWIRRAKIGFVLIVLVVLALVVIRRARSHTTPSVTG